MNEWMNDISKYDIETDVWDMHQAYPPELYGSKVYSIIKSTHKNIFM